MRLGPAARTVLTVLLSACVLLLVMETRALVSAQQALRKAEACFARAATASGSELDLDDGIAELRRAARWDAPFNSYARTARERLERVAETAEARSELARALYAYRSLHGALSATRGVFAWHASDLLRVDAHLARLMAQDLSPGTFGGGSADERAAGYAAELRVPHPDTFGVCLAFGGFLSWVLGFSALLLYGVDREGRVLRHIARPSFLCFIFGWVAFAVGLRIA